MSWWVILVFERVLLGIYWDMNQILILIPPTSNISRNQAMVDVGDETTCDWMEWTCFLGGSSHLGRGWRPEFVHPLCCSHPIISHKWGSNSSYQLLDKLWVYYGSSPLAHIKLSSGEGKEWFGAMAIHIPYIFPNSMRSTSELRIEFPNQMIVMCILLYKPLWTSINHSYFSSYIYHRP